MDDKHRRATVVGAGVSGLTTALALTEAGWSVEIVAAQTHEATVSSVAAAIWTMTAAEPVEAARRWALVSRERFARVAENAASGVASLRQREFERKDPGPLWWESTPYVRRLSADEVPDGYAVGFEIDGFIIEPPRYLAWLCAELAPRVTTTIATIDVLDDVDGDVVVNCSALGARSLAADDSLVPIRGQVVAVANPGITDAVADESDPDRVSYVYPRSTEVILGGSRQVGSDDSSVDEQMTERILADAAVLDPRVAGAEVLDVRVGLRPGRHNVRLEAESLPSGRTVIHNYGHGGAGYILSWGCAAGVVALAETGERRPGTAGDASARGDRRRTPRN